jgi:glycosyltransferase involved in cell wall biosynthesis
MKLSIITVNKNNAAGLEKTVKSVVNQTFTDFEYIVVDGTSIDGSVSVIKKYANKITWWVSEPDTGIYNAMNKGIRKAQGDYCLFLNSGDWLIETATLQKVLTEIASLPMAGIYYGDILYSDISRGSMNVHKLIDYPISHQNSLIHRSLFFLHGFYNENLKIASDWEFWLREYFIEKVPFVHIKTNICVFDVNGIGSKDSPTKQLEDFSIFKNVFRESADMVLELRDYHINVEKAIVSDIQNRRGPGIRFIVKCLIAWLFRKKLI